MPLLSGLLACFTALAVLLLFLANRELATTLSPQGCRMSFMSPSYVLQDGFNASWSRLATRYTLWLYREVGWDVQSPNGLPVLFIPGNAGSSHQVRSIASSASRQYYSSPGQVSYTFSSRAIRPLDVYAVEFNEDLSAFHGMTLQSQIEYTSRAIDYILSHYPPQTQLVILGHSMGGIVGTALLPSEHISAVITMSTPHTLPPARFDSKIDEIYAKVHHNLEKDTTPILSLCGGATDGMVPSESCILPSRYDGSYRETVFASAMEGAWTGVGHREMVWCHQVRWRVARAVLEFGSKTSTSERIEVLDKWIRDGHKLPSGLQGYQENNSNLDRLDNAPYEIIPSHIQLVRKPTGSSLYLVPVPSTINGTSTARLSVLVGKGSIATVPVHVQHGFKVSIYICSETEEGNSVPRCSPLRPTTLKLLPKPIPGELFPRPRSSSDPSSGGVDESDGVVLYEAEVEPSFGRWIGVKADNGGDDSWVVAGFNQKEGITSVHSTTSLLFRNAFVDVKADDSMRLDIHFPRLVSNALIVYRLVPHFQMPLHCTESHLAPLLIHTSHTVETHYYPLLSTDDRRILLHTHYPAPYHDKQEQKGLHLIIYSSGNSSCINRLEGLELSIDWSATLGRLASRYLTTLVGWAAGISSIILFLALGTHDRGIPMPSVDQSMRYYEKVLSRFLIPVSFLASFLPWPRGFYLGLGSSAIFAPLAPLILLLASGLVAVSWGALRLSLFLLRPISVILVARHEGSTAGRTTVVSLCIICAMIFMAIPWQVAFLGCWMQQLLTCAIVKLPTSPLAPITAESYDLLDRSSPEERDNNFRPQAGEQNGNNHSTSQDNHHLNCHILLFMTWLLPLVGPVLAVWVRTLLTAGLTTPFDGDHFFLNVLPFLVMVDFSSWTLGPIFLRQRFEDCISTRWSLSLVAIISFFVGGTQPHKIFDAGKIAIGLLVGVRIGRRYWGGSPWVGSIERRRT